MLWSAHSPCKSSGVCSPSRSQPVNQPTLPALPQWLPLSHSHTHTHTHTPTHTHTHTHTHTLCLIHTYAYHTLPLSPSENRPPRAGSALLYSPLHRTSQPGTLALIHPCPALSYITAQAAQTHSCTQC